MAAIKKALKVARHYHGATKRKSGELFYTHPLWVAQKLLAHTDDPALIVSALLHDTLEDTAYNIHQLRAMFGERIATIVRGVTHLYSKANRPKIKLDKAETLDRLIAQGSRDALIIKVFDRWHNMETLQFLSKAAQKRVIEETLRIFVPMARHLGHADIAEKLIHLAKKNQNHSD